MPFPFEPDRRPNDRALHRPAMTATTASPRESTSPRHLAWLALVYGVQGLPYGFQASALGVYLRERGLSRSAIGFAGALAAPWLLKVLWAPLVDRHRGGPLGARRSWIVPMQVALALSMVGAALLPENGDVHPLLFLVFLMNLFAATMDIAVDGLAIDLLRPHELGLGNAIQVVGYKIGMLTGGGLLVWATGHLGWTPLFWCMAALTLLVSGFTLTMHEPASAHHAQGSLREVVMQLWATLRQPGAIAVVLLVVSYKFGEALIDPMIGPLLTDHGVPRETIGLWVGTYGMATSIAGSVVGGLLVQRTSLSTALLVAGALRGVPIALEVAVAFDAVPLTVVPYALAAEHFFAGMLTTAMFAFMMSRVDRRIGASHYTLLANVEVLGKTPPSMLSGVLADHLGYGPAFSIGLGAALLWPVLAGPLLVRTKTAASPQ